MSQAVANPDDMERFARELKQFNSILADSIVQVLPDRLLVHLGIKGSLVV